MSGLPKKERSRSEAARERFVVDESRIGVGRYYNSYSPSSSADVCTNPNTATSNKQCRSQRLRDMLYAHESDGEDEDMEGEVGKMLRLTQALRQLARLGPSRNPRRPETCETVCYCLPPCLSDVEGDTDPHFCVPPERNWASLMGKKIGVAEEISRKVRKSRAVHSHERSKSWLFAKTHERSKS